MQDSQRSFSQGQGASPETTPIEDTKGIHNSRVIVMSNPLLFTSNFAGKNFRGNTQFQRISLFEVKFSGNLLPAASLDPKVRLETRNIRRGDRHRSTEGKEVNSSQGERIYSMAGVFSITTQKLGENLRSLRFK
jgi:hypothetical protein